MIKLCHHVKDDKKVCQAVAMRGQIYCRHHLELTRRLQRIAQAKRRSLQRIMTEQPLNSLFAVRRAKERIEEGISLDRLDPETSRVILLGLRLLASTMRSGPKELAEWMR